MPKVNLHHPKRFKSSSQNWLKRQLNDPYVQEAQRLGYRSRAVFKLLQIQEKYKILHSNSKVVDLGCAPGGWSQACRVLCPQGFVIGVDLTFVEPIPGVTLIQGDFCTESVQQKILSTLQDEHVDVVLSDMAPSTLGDRRTDHLRIMVLAEEALAFALNVLKPGGCFVVKTRQGGASPDLLRLLRQSFHKVSHFKPASSRSGSSEMFTVAQNLKDHR